jgi:hypothetical protein
VTRRTGQEAGTDHGRRSSSPGVRRTDVPPRGPCGPTGFAFTGKPGNRTALWGRAARLAGALMGSPGNPAADQAFAESPPSSPTRALAMSCCTRHEVIASARSSPSGSPPRPSRSSCSPTVSAGSPRGPLPSVRLLVTVGSQPPVLYEIGLAKAAPSLERCVYRRNRWSTSSKVPGETSRGSGTMAHHLASIAGLASRGSVEAKTANRPSRDPGQRFSVDSVPAAHSLARGARRRLPAPLPPITKLNTQNIHYGTDLLVLPELLQTLARARRPPSAVR